MRIQDVRIPIIVFGLSWAVFSEAIMSSEGWANMPWVDLGSVAFGAALVAIAWEFFDPRSRIKEFWRKITNKFEIVSIYTNPQAEPERVTLCVSIRFLKDIDIPTLRLYSTSVHRNLRKREVVYKQDLKSVVKGQCMTIPIISLRCKEAHKPAWHGVYGQDRGVEHYDKEPLMGPDFRGIIEVDIDGESHGFYAAKYTFHGGLPNEGFEIIDREHAIEVLERI